MANLLEDVADKKIEDELLDRKIRSIFDLAYTYGKLQLLADEQQLERDNISVSKSYLKYMTPSNEQVKQYFDDPNKLISVRLSWDGERFVYDGLEFEKLSWENAVVHGYCRPISKAGRMIAHSICQLTSSNGYDFESTSGKLADRVTRWPSDSIVKDVASSHKDGWIIDALDQFGSNVASTDSWKTKVEEALESKLSGQSKFKGLMSVKIDVGDGKGYQSPGELDVLNEGMKQKKLDRLGSYSEADDSTGNSSCYITGDKGEVYGLTPGSPANFFTGKQHGTFPDMDPDQSWRAKPLCSDAALAVLKSSAMFDELGYAVSKDEKIGYYPYYEEMNALKSRDIYQTYTELSESENIPAGVANWVESYSERYIALDVDDKRIYALLYEEDQNSVYNILNEVKSCRVEHLHNIFNQWKHMLSNPFVQSEVGVYDTDEDGYDWFLDDQKTQREFIEQIFNGGFFKTVFEQVDYSGNAGGVFNLTLDLIGNRRISYSQLVSEYTENMISRQNWMLGEPDVKSDIPSKLIFKQYIHFHVLTKTGSLFTETTPQSLSHIKDSFEVVMFEDRDERLDAYIESHSGLDDPEKRSLFLLGGLVGRLSQYQRHNLDLSKTLAEQYPINSISKNRIQDLTQNVLGKNVQYSEMKNIVMNSRYTDRLRDSVLEKDLDDWILSTNEARFYYSLGLSYGYSDFSIDDEEYSEEKNEVPQN